MVPCEACHIYRNWPSRAPKPLKPEPKNPKPGTLKPPRALKSESPCRGLSAAGGFAFDLLWLTRAALVAPVVTAATQTLRPGHCWGIFGIFGGYSGLG